MDERIQLEFYETQEGDAPYLDWFESIRDKQTRRRIERRIRQLRLGSLGPRKSVGAGVTELILDFGPGYRIYAGRHGDRLVILLCGGDKHTQANDIEMAKYYWADFKFWMKEEERNGATK